MNDLGSKIKQIRVARGYTQDDIAEKMNVQRTTISNWEKNIRVPDSNKLIEYARIVGVTLDFFNDNSTERTLFETMADLDALFMSVKISQADKDKAIKDIMDIYWKSKELTGIVVETPEVSLQHSKAKEE